MVRPAHRMVRQIADISAEFGSNVGEYPLQLRGLVLPRAAFAY
jgi:hypothetical protein